jgi:NTP pyrophosphatase (non-canonical NTP hydrolase)
MTAQDEEQYPLIKMTNIPALAWDAYEGYLSHGFENDERIIALKMFMEVAEVSEVLRQGDPTSRVADHIGEQGFNQLEEELADVILLALILAGRYRLNISDALEAKHKYNLGRPYKHGKSW